MIFKNAKFLLKQQALQIVKIYYFFPLKKEREKDSRSPYLGDSTIVVLILQSLMVHSDDSFLPELAAHD